VRFRQTIDRTLAPLVADCSLFDLVLLSVMAGVGEEVLFRGVVQAALAGSVGPVLAIAVSALLFGLAHFVSVTYAVYATLFGVYLGVMLVVFGNLLAPVITHAVYDFVALAYLVYVRFPADAARDGRHPPA
jgi:membrane protease YdiL (CAAX protease family)